MTLHETLTQFPTVWPAILAMDTARYLAFAGAAFLLLWLLRGPLERFRIQKRKAGVRDMRREIGWSLSTSVIFSLNGFFLVWGLAQVGVVDIHHDTGGWIIALEVVAIVIAHDAWFYWLHRAMHGHRLFRAVHLTHHRSITPSPWAAYAFSPAEALAEALFLPAFLLALNIDGLTILIFLMHMMARNVIGHCGFEFLPRGWVDWPLTRWITTPTHHDLHHAYGRWNFGLYFTFWDRVMGTEHPEYRTHFRHNAAGPEQQPPPATDGKRKGAITGMFLTAAAILTGGAAPVEAQDIQGTWASPGLGAVVRIARCDPGPSAPQTLCASVVWTWDPNGPRGANLFSDLVPSPDPGNGMKHSVRELSGKVLNPEDRQTYDAHMRLVGPDLLQVEGCVWVFCQTQQWSRLKPLLETLDAFAAAGN